MFQKIPLKIEIPFTPSSRKSPIKSSTQIYDHNSFTFAISSPKFGFNPNFFHSSTVKKTDDITELYSNDLNNPESIASEKSSPNNKLKYLKKRLNLNDLTQEHLLELAIMILQKGRGFRNNMDIRMLERTTKNVEFFQKYDKDTIEQICKHMMYQSAEKNETLFDIGSLGDTFYIILKGSVEVWINIPKTIEEIKPDGSVESRTERILTNVRTLQAGNSFGELSLLENQPRAATIVCREKCFFGVLDKTSFDNILKEKETRKLYEKINFYASMKLFGKWSYNSVKLLYYQTEILDFQRNQIVLKEEQESLGIYLIKSGEFKVMLKIPIHFKEEDKINYPYLKDTKKLIQLCVLNSGEIFGEEEIITGKNYEFSVICTSQKGVLFFLNKKEFLRRVWSEENSRIFLQKTTKTKKIWRDSRIAELTQLEKSKILNQSIIKPSIPVLSSLFKRVSEKRSVVNDDNQSKTLSFRVSNKIEPEDDIYSGFKLLNVKKLEKLEKFHEAKEKMNVSSNPLKKSRSFLTRLIKDSTIPKKMKRDLGNCKKTEKTIPKIKTGKLENLFIKSVRNTIKPYLNPTNTAASYKQIQAFTSVKKDGKHETNPESIKFMKFYSEIQKKQYEQKRFFDETKFDDEKKDLNEKNNKTEEVKKWSKNFKKNIQNIFVTASYTDYNKKNNGTSLRLDSSNIESFDFLNVSSKTIYNKII